MTQAKYATVVQMIRQSILGGQLEEGAQLPPEAALMARHGVARGTVRRALEQLADEGVLRAEHGVGWFVQSQRPDARPFRLHEEQLTSTARFRVVRHLVEPASPERAARLNIAPQTALVHIIQVRLDGADAHSLTERLLPLELCPELATADLSRRSAGDILAHHALVQPNKATFSIETRELEAHHASLLGVVAGTSVLAVERLTYTAPTQPAVWHYGLFLHGYDLHIAF